MAMPSRRDEDNQRISLEDQIRAGRQLKSAQDRVLRERPVDEKQAFINSMTNYLSDRRGAIAGDDDLDDGSDSEWDAD